MKELSDAAFPAAFYEYLNAHTLVGIKGGTDRETFLDIWMVAINSRVFARTWNKSERSWFTAFLETGAGQIRYGEKIVPLYGRKLVVEPEITRAVNRAYLDKYHQPENIFYAEGITRPEYADFTMEFFYAAQGGSS